MPTRNGEAFLDRVLAALADQRIDVPWSFFAIDSGSTDATIAILDRWCTNFSVPFRVERIHPLEFNHGDTRNRLAARVDADLLVFLTQDAIPTRSDWLATLAQNFADPRVAVAYSRNVPRPDAALLTRLFSENDPGYATERREQRISDAAAYSRMTPDERRLLFNNNDVAAAYRRDLWERHPFPRTDFGEDVLMARAFIEAGYTVVYDNVATVEHSHDYRPHEMRARAHIDGRFNAEWLGRICVNSRTAAAILTNRQLDRDRAAMQRAGVMGDELARDLRHARELRQAAFVGMYEGGRSERRHLSSRMLDRAKLRILYVVHGFPPEAWAGTEVYTLGLALEMKNRGHEVAILTRSPGSENDGAAHADFSLREDEFKGLPVWRMTHRLAHGSLRQSYNQPAAEAPFRELVERWKPDVVHFQHLIHLSASLPHVSRALGVPSIVTVNDYWPLCARVQLIRPDAVRCESNQGLGCLLCVGNRAYQQIPVAKRLTPLLLPLARLTARATLPGLQTLAAGSKIVQDLGDRFEYVTGAYAACDRVIAPSRFLRQKLIDSGRFDAASVIYSDYGTATAAPDSVVRAPARRHEVIRFGYIGSLIWHKGVDVLMRAMRKLDTSSVVLNVFGSFRPAEDPYQAQLAALAQECGDRVRFHGPFDNNRLSEVYQHVDVLVVPSIWFENSPLTIHEAFLFRTPIVTSDIGGMAELVEHGRNGLHFQTGNADALAATLARFVNEPGLLGELTHFPPIKTMADDASDLEVQYRELVCIDRGRTARGAPAPHR